jgi:hypothetical protein
VEREGIESSRLAAPELYAKAGGIAKREGIVNGISVAAAVLSGRT